MPSVNYLAESTDTACSLKEVHNRQYKSACPDVLSCKSLGSSNYLQREEFFKTSASQENPRIYATRRFIALLKQPATSPYPETDKSNPRPQSLFP